jgi:sterol O-acyltransferase
VSLVLPCFTTKQLVPCSLSSRVLTLAPRLPRPPRPVLFALQTIIRYYQETGVVFSSAFFNLLRGDALELAISDAVMVGSSYLCVPFVMAVEKGILPYYWGGLVVQHVAQTLYLLVTVIWVFNK